jgi:predicted RNA polymerase sigma factor
VDALRHRTLASRKHDVLALDAGDAAAPPASEDDPSSAGDELLGLVLTACHPVLSLEARVALTLRLLCGLETDEIARAFLVPTATVAQRIVRAKRTLEEARVPFEVPRGTALAERLPAVLQVVYLVFNEGYAATSGGDWMRPALCEEALRLGRVLAGLVPGEPEVHGLVALMELHASRARARTGPDGAPVPLLEQDRGRWDGLLLRHGLAALARAEARGGARGPYALQAAIAAEHARARTAEATDWPRIAALYDALGEVAPSPIIELNRAMAVGMAYGPEAGLEVLEGLRDEPALAGYHLLPAARADLLSRLGRHAEARGAFLEAAGLTRNARERAALLERAAEEARREIP